MSAWTRGWQGRAPGRGAGGDERLDALDAGTGGADRLEAGLAGPSAWTTRGRQTAIPKFKLRVLTSESLLMTPVFEKMKNCFGNLQVSISKTMVILCEAWTSHQLNTGEKNTTAFPLLSPSDEDDASNEQQDSAATSGTIDGKEKSTWQAAVVNAENDDIQQLPPTPRPNNISDDDYKNIRSFCRPEPSMELLAVYPYFPFYGTIMVFDENSGQYVYHQEKGEKCNLDSQGNLVLTGPFETISGFGVGGMKIDIPDLRGPGGMDTAIVDFRDDRWAADVHEERIITTENGRELVVTYVEMNIGLGVHVLVSLRLFGDDKFETIGVHGQITGHNWLFGDDCVLLFLCGEEEKVQLTPSAGSNGSVILKPMQRCLVTVPVNNTLPLLTIKVRLNVTSPSNEGATITFEGDVAFPLEKDQKIRTILTNHGEVEISISY